MRASTSMPVYLRLWLGARRKVAMISAAAPTRHKKPRMASADCLVPLVCVQNALKILRVRAILKAAAHGV